MKFLDGPKHGSPANRPPRPCQVLLDRFGGSYLNAGGTLDVWRNSVRAWTFIRIGAFSNYPVFLALHRKERSGWCIHRGKHPTVTLVLHCVLESYLDRIEP